MARALVALSGGVDSAVAAALLVRDGWEVIGVTAHLVDLSPQGLGVSRCCAPQDVELARAAAWRLGIPHYLLDMEETFRSQVLEPFIAGYLSGTTPSPCIRCNSRVKVGGLMPVADRFGAEVVATGHYARTDIDEQGRPRLFRGRDLDRDQSYFLFDLSLAHLQRLAFPLGLLTKAEVRALAGELDLPNAERRDSQEVCFVPPGWSYPEVLERLAPGRAGGAGDMVDLSGTVLGTHKGIHHYTVGQRRGLGLSGQQARYVVALDAASNRVVVGGATQVERRTIGVQEINWLIPEPSEEFTTTVQVRSRHQPAAAAVVPLPGRRAEVRFEHPVAAPAPGQAAVFYQGSRVLGGGWIGDLPDADSPAGAAPDEPLT